MEEEFVEATAWVKRGDRMVNRDYLSFNDEESWISLWRNKYGDLEGFPWKEIYGSVPSTMDLVRAGMRECPMCGQKMNPRDYLNDNILS